MDDQIRLRRKDTTKGPPLRILTLDGGGVRGYSMLIILQELMHRTFVEIEGRAPKRHEIPKPCDYFDLIAGTGTGGLIAIMLGRLRLDLDTCKEVYVRMTRRVFETDKTFLGMPLKGTMFKASKLEESIRQVAREHTIFEDEGNDTLANATPMTPMTPNSTIPQIPRRSMSQSSKYSQIGMSPVSNRVSYQTLKFGNANAALYDSREQRTKTAVTAVLKGTKVITLLRSYDSRKEPAPDVNCTIWQAGRATSATQMAFKPIQIGQSVYLDEGAGKYNPSPQILDEAVQNEWPGREVGLFVSIGTGKRPPGSNKNSHEWWEEVVGSEWIEARRKLFEKIEGCEESHKFMLREHLAARGVNPENYVRLNVEVGVGEMGMNEWNRLNEMTTSTRSYLSRKEIQAMTLDVAAKLAKIHFTKVRHDRAEARRHAGADGPHYNHSEGNPNPAWERPSPTANPNMVELQGDDTYIPGYQPDQRYSVQPDTHYLHRPSIADQKYTVSSDGYDQPSNYSPPQRPAHLQYPGRTSLESHNSVRFSNDTFPDVSPRPSHEHQPQSPPPVPPKTPVNAGPLPYPDHQRTASINSQNAGPRTFMNMGELGRNLPYPRDDVTGPPPTVNMANKPSLPP